MIRQGIVNPAIQSLLCRVRHTNTLVIADRGFPFWPGLETIDISLTDDIPTVVEVLRAVLQNFHAGSAVMAAEFLESNSDLAIAPMRHALGGVPLAFVAHAELKRRVPGAIGLIRTGDTTQYANIVLESA
ncbi:MAG TPA: RbsD/FucU domain-containing protein [Acidobacteriaceae bacterium]